MRFVAWNCAEGFTRDLVHVRALSCDVAVLAEVPQRAPEESLLDPGIDWHWIGQYSRRGLALAGFGTALTPLDARANSGTFCSAASTEFGLGVLGIWSWRPDDSTYGAQVVSAITAHADFLASGPAIIAGDFNLVPGRLEDASSGVLRKVFTELDRLGYVSAYHHCTGEEYGHETTPTYFHHRREAEPFHMDFCFIHRDLLPRIVSFQVGSFDDYVEIRDGVTGMSDHVPLILDLDFG